MTRPNVWTEGARRREPLARVDRKRDDDRTNREPDTKMCAQTFQIARMAAYIGIDNGITEAHGAR